MVYFLLVIAVVWLIFDRKKLKFQLGNVLWENKLYLNQYWDLKQETEEELHKGYKDKYKWGEVDSDDPCSFCKAFDECSKDNNLLVYCQKTYFNCCILKIKY